MTLRDAYALLLHLTHYDRMGCARLYMKAGTSNAPKNSSVHEIRMLLYFFLLGTLLAFHAITECDSVTASKPPGRYSSNITVI